MRGRTIAKIVVAALVVVGIYAYFKDDITQLWDNLHVKIAEYPQPKKTVWLDQNVSREKLSWFYHADQGTRTFGIPYEWFIALEQPTIPWLIFTSVDPLQRPGLPRSLRLHSGYHPSPTRSCFRSASRRAARCWIRRARRGATRSNKTGHDRHRPDLRGLSYRTIHLQGHGRHHRRRTGAHRSLQAEAGNGRGAALYAISARPLQPVRRTRSWDENSTVADRETLKYQIDQVLKQYKAVKDLEQAVASQSILEGYGRLDALNRIGNQVFSLDLKKPENYAGSSAPVHYPRIWNTPWFDWVQYNGSIMQPMVRNAGESLGVSAELNLTDPSKGLFKSSVDVDNLHEMEQMIAGKPPNAKDGFSGLTIAEMAGGHPAQDRLDAGGQGRANSTRSIVRNVIGHRSRFTAAANQPRPRHAEPCLLQLRGQEGVANQRGRPAGPASSKTSRSSISAPIPRRRRT